MQRIAQHYRRVFQGLPSLRLICLLFGALLGGCTYYAHQRFSNDGIITGAIASGETFQHQIYRPRAKRSSAELHIYIEGDGVPWRARYLIASDPTSRNSSMLQAMLKDSTEAVFLGRPCYYQVTDPQCRGKWWTSDRYSPEVVNSMLEIVERLAGDERDLWLIGHSGGGALAVLIGRRLKRPVKVVTVAGNLDLAAWVQHHRYSPLKGSLDPLTETNPNPAMRELHWYGRHDSNVLPAWTLRYCEHQGVSCKAYNGDHGSGWLEQWPRLIRESRDHFNAAAPQHELTPENNIAP